MSASAKLLDRLSRVRQSRPGSWMAACPCCESRKGRPLAITEKDDGRVLLHAFCGCSTEDVLGRLGLEIADLFDKPLVHVPPTAARVPAGDVLTSLSHEATTLAVIASDMLDGRPIDEPTWARLSTAVARVTNAADYINERAK